MAGEVTFTPTSEHYLAANRDWFKHTIRRRSSLLRVAAVVILVAAAGGWLFAFPKDWQSRAVTGLEFGLLAGLAIAIGYGVQYLMQPREVRRLYRQQKALQKPWHYAWTDKGLEFASADSDARVEWSDLHRWSDGPRTFLFMLNDRLFYFLPFSVLSEEQVQDLRSTASRFGPPRR